jgi:peptide/bleomycin uptake transporter
MLSMIRVLKRSAIRRVERRSRHDAVQRQEPRVFVSFFPSPRWFFWSALVWTALVIAAWYGFGEQLGASVGLPPAAADAPPIIGMPVFWSEPFLWFYIYYAAAVAIFAAAWSFAAPHPWLRWSI